MEIEEVSCYKLPLVGHHKAKMEKEEKRSEERESDVHVHGCSRSTHIYGSTHVYACTIPDSCTERPTAMFLDAYLWKLAYSELML